MHILIGLGNPGRDYARHRHNIGFMVMDEIASHYHLGGFKRKLNGEILEGRIAGQKVMLVKPQTYMNKAVIARATFWIFISLRPTASPCSMTNWT